MLGVQYLSSGLLSRGTSCLMQVSIECYRAKIGCFNQTKVSGTTRKSTFSNMSFMKFILAAIVHELRHLKILVSIILSFLIASLFVLCFFCLALLIVSFHIHDALHFLASAGNLNMHKPSRFFINKFVQFFELSLFIIISSTVIMMLLTSSGTIETNPGPPFNNINFGVWNLDSLVARDGVKKSFIEGLDSSYNFDLFGICESYLTNNVDDSELKICGFSEAPFRADCTYAARPRGGVCLYYKEHIPIIERKDLEIIDETIVAEIKLKNKKVFYILSYRPPSKSSVVEINDYCSNLQKNN